LKTIILAGGLGTRLQEETIVKPKPMVEIGGQPILWHIMKCYSTYGVKDFAVAMGYKAEVIRSYFLNYYYYHSNLTVHLDNGKVDIHGGDYVDWTVFLSDTGANSQTGGRLKRLSSWIANETFMFTYGDGVADIDINKLLAFHRSHGKLATITVVRPPSRFGWIDFDGDAVKKFEEKPITGEEWASAGFFVVEPEALNLIEGDDTIWERGPLETLAATGQLMAYRHEGFWQSMDTIRDVQYLEKLWSSGQAPWKVW
jgi:glucose-1-phosphate cytidylyltransferase